MSEVAKIKEGLKKDWALTQDAFHRFLDWLDEGIQSGGEKYLEVRRRLVAYFDRKNCRSPDELADETLNRVARRLQEEGAITDTPPVRYCYIVAKFVFLEDLRKEEHRQESLDELRPSSQTKLHTTAMTVRDSQADEEDRLNCFEKCLQNVEPDNRELILQYYCGAQRAKIDNRRSMAEGLGITINALSIRAFRIREKLESCVSKCLKPVE